MYFLTNMWLPIVLSAVAVFVASSIIWMATPLHKKDFTPPPDEEGFLAFLRKSVHAPGMYYFPWCQGQNMKDPAYQEKLKQGPWAMMIVQGSAPSFGKCLGLWFVNLLVVSALVGVAAWCTIPHGDVAPPNTPLFRGLLLIAFLAHAGMAAQDPIWKGLSFRYAFIKCIDGAVYALITAGIFTWLWQRSFTPIAG